MCKCNYVRRQTPSDGKMQTTGSKFINFFFKISFSYGDGRPTSIIGHWAKQSTGVPTYTTTHRNKTVTVDTIKHILIVLVLQTTSVFKHRKTCHTHHTQISIGPICSWAAPQHAHVLRRHCLWFYYSPPIMISSPLKCINSLYGWTYISPTRILTLKVSKMIETLKLNKIITIIVLNSKIFTTIYSFNSSIFFKQVRQKKLISFLSIKIFWKMHLITKITICNVYN